MDKPLVANPKASETKSKDGAIRIHDGRHLAFCHAYSSSVWTDPGPIIGGEWPQVVTKELTMDHIIKAKRDHVYDPGNKHYKHMYHHATKGDAQLLGTHLSEKKIGEFKLR